MLIPVEELPENLILPDTTVWLGPNKHFVTYHVNGGKSINCVCLVEQDGWLNESWSEKGEIGELKRAYKGWNRTIETLLQHADPNTLYKWALHDRLPMKQWSKGRIIVLGRCSSSYVALFSSRGSYGYRGWRSSSKLY